MDYKKYFPNTALAMVLGGALGVCRTLRVFAPMCVLPVLNIPNMVLISLLALLLDHYLVGEVRRCDPFTLILAALTFGLLPYASGFAVIGEAMKLALVGGIVFTLTAWLFSQMQDRLSTGYASKAAPIFSALGLFLAAQCFAGLII